MANYSFHNVVDDRRCVFTNQEHIMYSPRSRKVQQNWAADSLNLVKISHRSPLLQLALL